MKFKKDKKYNFMFWRPKKLKVDYILRETPVDSSNEHYEALRKMIIEDEDKKCEEFYLDFESKATDSFFEINKISRKIKDKYLVKATPVMNEKIAFIAYALIDKKTNEVLIDWCDESHMLNEIKKYD